jgi:hypothetical protein
MYQHLFWLNRLCSFPRKYCYDAIILRFMKKNTNKMCDRQAYLALKMRKEPKDRVIHSRSFGSIWLNFAFIVPDAHISKRKVAHSASIPQIAPLYSVGSFASLIHVSTTVHQNRLPLNYLVQFLHQ